MKPLLKYLLIWAAGVLAFTVTWYLLNGSVDAKTLTLSLTIFSLIPVVIKSFTKSESSP